MGLTGTVLELLLPGVIADFAALIALEAIGIVDNAVIAQQSSALTVFAVLASAYLVGIAMRQLDRPIHSMHLIQWSHTIVANRLNDRWPTAARWIIGKMGYAYAVDARRTVVFDMADATARLTDKDAGELIALLGDCLVATQQTAWSQNLNYHLNLARLARNSVTPLIALGLACTLSAIVQAKVGGHHRLAFTALGITSWCLLPVMRRVHRNRIQYHTDILIRTALIHFAHGDAPGTTGDPGEVAGTAAPDGPDGPRSAAAPL